MTSDDQKKCICVESIEKWLNLKVIFYWLKGCLFSFYCFSLLSNKNRFQLIVCFLTIVYADGSICLDILQNRWSPTYDVSAILTSIQSLLDEPNPNSPANSLAAQLYQENRREYEKRVAAIVEQSWLNFSEDEEKEAKKES